MKSIRNLVVIGAAGLATMSANLQAQPVPTAGEISAVRLCFYECKDGARSDWWQEVTTLMVMNPDAETIVHFAILDGNENFIARTAVNLSEDDLDELNVCRTLEAAGIVPPSAGMVEVFSSVGGLDGYYVTVKNLIGKFFKTVDEPFDGRVVGVGKTECRVVPPTVTTGEEISAKLQAANPPTIAPILIEDTAE